MTRANEASEDEDLPDGVYHDDDWPTVACPYCREAIAEDSERCPHCGNWLSKDDSPLMPKSSFWLTMMVLAVLAVLVMIGLR